MHVFRAATLVALHLLPFPLVAQSWNSEQALALVDRAIARRSAQQADTTLRDYRSRAHGFVFFLAQLGEGLAEPPRLVKSDQLELEVYWQAPGRSKQRIIGWRDRADLPTDIQYHRDHLGIIQNNFGDRIRLGHGDEVRDVTHPLAPEAPRLYDYAIEAPVSLRLPAREVEVHEVRLRPKDFGEPLVLGSLFIDVTTAELVLFRFTFTRVAYLDDTLEDITIVLENGLWDGRYWLPRRQEIEIRRRTAWLDLPARGIIRGRWEVEAYAFNLGLDPQFFLGPEIVLAPLAERDTFPWTAPLAASVRAVSGPVAALDLQTVRGEIAELAGARAISGLAVTRPGVGSISDLAHVNRVEGLALGLGGVVRPGGGPWEVRAAASVGIADERAKGRLEIGRATGRTAVRVVLARSVVDIGDEPVISPLLNSILAQELGEDYGDYVLADRAYLAGRYAIGGQIDVAARFGVERSTSLDVVATPATGAFDANPALGVGTLGVGELVVSRRPATLERGGVSGAVAVEGGAGRGRRYVRLAAKGRLAVSLGATELELRAMGGWGSGELPPHRAFVFGGRGTLVGEQFRAWGGRYAVWGGTEWRVPVPFPALGLGPFASTGRQLVLAPFVGAGWAGGGFSALPWEPTGTVRPVVGLGLEWFHRLIRADVGVGLRDAEVRFVIDVRRDLWPIL